MSRQYVIDLASCYMQMGSPDLNSVNGEEMQQLTDPVPGILESTIMIPEFARAANTFLRTATGASHRTPAPRDDSSGSHGPLAVFRRCVLLPAPFPDDQNRLYCAWPGDFAVGVQFTVSCAKRFQKRTARPAWLVRSDSTRPVHGLAGVHRHRA